MTLTGDTAIWAAWAMIAAAVVVGRTRWARARERASAEAMKIPVQVGVRRGVLTTLVVRLPGLAERLVEDPSGSYLVLAGCQRLAQELGAAHDVELEAPGAEGLRLFLGRFEANPNHREAGLGLALALSEALAEHLAVFGWEPAAIGVCTGDALSAPFPSGGQLHVATLGRGPAQAAALAAAAEAGEVLVDEGGAEVLRGFVTEVGEGGVRLLGRAEPEPVAEDRGHSEDQGDDPAEDQRDDQGDDQDDDHDDHDDDQDDDQDDPDVSETDAVGAELEVSQTDAPVAPAEADPDVDEDTRAEEGEPGDGEGDPDAPDSSPPGRGHQQAG